MFLPAAAGSASFLRRRSWLTEHGIPQPWIALPLLFGLVLGTVFGLFSSWPAGLDSIVAAAYPGQGFWQALWQGSRFVVAALLVSTSFLGFAALPVLSVLRGFFLGCGVAVYFQANGFPGLLSAFAVFGVPALLGLPAFLLAASDGTACSLQLLRCFTGGERRPPSAQGGVSRHLAMIVFLCFLDALYCAFLLPMILNALP